ncbi:MAG: exo-alpha-sialidase [Planctomycetes bacterium]|nr:exo-alpha-sialidase [Planctomycetota bacterium]
MRTIHATLDPVFCLCQAAGWLCCIVGLLPGLASGQEPMRDAIAVVNRQALSTDTIECERVPLGEPDDYKPCIALLPSGELLLTAFHPYEKKGGKVFEQNLLFRSKDGGKTWSKPQKLDLLGREPYLTVLKDGTVFMTGHLLAQDIRNKHGYTQPYFVWRSKDGGKTWDKSQKCEPKDFKSQYGFFGGETWLWQARSGKIWALVRVDSNELPIKGRPIKSKNDQSDHFILFSSADGGRTFDRIRDFGDYGEMYMSIVRLQDKRLLLTFTVRDLNPPLGVRALPGEETKDGFTFDFSKDRVLLDTKTGSRFQGGGFGPTVQLKDGTLVTSYSYRGKDDKTHLEVVRWKLPAAR